MEAIFKLPMYEWNYFQLLPEYKVALLNATAAELNVEAFPNKRGKLAEGGAKVGLVVSGSIVWDLIKGQRAEGFKTVFERAQRNLIWGNQVALDLAFREANDRSHFRTCSDSK